LQPKSNQLVSTPTGCGDNSDRLLALLEYFFYREWELV
jgi:hypothetical protein